MPDPWVLLFAPTVAVAFLWAVAEFGVAYLHRAARHSDGGVSDD